MSPEAEVKKHCKILLIVIVVVFFFGDSFLLDKKLKRLRSLKSQIRKKQTEKSNYDSLKLVKESLQREIEKYKDSMETLFSKFPSDENTENRLMNILANITSKLIVKDEKRKPKYVKMWETKDIPVYEVPKVTDNDPTLSLGNRINIAFYESNLDLRCNYFELLQFFHDLANAEIYISPMDIKINPDLDVPYGTTVKVRLLSFGFEGFVVEKKF